MPRASYTSGGTRRSYTAEELKDKTLDELREIYPNVPARFLPSYVRRKEIVPSRNFQAEGNVRKNAINRSDKEARKVTSKISKSINTQKFMEHLANSNHIEIMADLYMEVMVSTEEKTEHRLKAADSIAKYTMIPSQAQELKVEVDTTYNEDKRAQLAELLAKAEKVMA